MVENDPAVIDIDYWIDLYKRTHAQAITLAAGGYVAYYPTRIPYHHKSKYLAKPGPVWHSGGTLKGSACSMSSPEPTRTPSTRTPLKPIPSGPPSIARATNSHWTYPEPG